MINPIIDKLIDNLPDTLKNTDKPTQIDLILGGGAFNGSYLIGALFFLKEMEKRKYVKINRISGCSVGSILGLLYLIDELNYFIDTYNIFIDSFKKNYNLSIIKNIKYYLNHKLPPNLIQLINNKLFISYNNVLQLKKKVTKTYKNADDLYDKIIKSCFVPYLIDNNFLYKNTYIDGITPYFFKKKDNTQLLFLNLYTIDKIQDIIQIKNEKTNIHRIFLGILEMNTFYIKNTNTYMCNDLKKLSIISYLFNIYILLFEKIIIYILFYLILFRKNKIYKFIYIKNSILKNIYIKFIKRYCI